MTFNLKRVELSNIRSHKHTVFTPRESGITALRGSNGAGKSTIVDSIAWALYGTKPGGVSKVSAIYREGAEFGKDKCFVIVDFEIEGYWLRVERRMITKGGNVESDVWEVSLDDEGEEVTKHVAGPASSHVKKYITKRLNMDEKGFLSAILVQQKEVDHLISSPPAERARIIEKLTGISAITAALSEISKEHNSLKKIAGMSTVDEVAVKKLKTDKDKLLKALEKKKDALYSLRDKAIESKSLSKTLSEDLEEKNAAFITAEKLREELAVNVVRIESADSELERLTEERADLRHRLSLVASGVSIDQIEPKVNKLKQDLRAEELNSSKLEASLRNDKEELKALKSLLESTDVDYSDSSKKIKELEKEIKTKTSEIKKSNTENISLNADIKKIQKAITVLNKGDGVCPTCLQEVSDVSIAVKALETEISSLTEQSSSLLDVMSDLEGIKSDLESSVEKLRELSEAEKRSEVISSGIKSLTVEENKVKVLVKTLESELSALDKIYTEAKNNRQTKIDYDRILDRSKKVSNGISALNERQDKIKETLSNSGVVSSTALSKLRVKYEKERDKSSELSMKLSESKGDYKLDQERLTNLESNITRGEDEVEKYKDLLKSVEVAASSRGLIEKFREERVESSIPVIEAYSSDLISRFTQGKFTQLLLDSNFNATVRLATGAERPVGLLSGGELSAAAMSLRLAISMLLNAGSSTNLIILDEVLVSQDTERAEMILSTIKEVCKGQVVLIAHNDSIDAIADKVVELEAKINTA